MVTGDYHNTAIAVAKDVGMVEAEADVLVIDAAPSKTQSIQPLASAHKLDSLVSMPSIKPHVRFSMTIRSTAAASIVDPSASSMEISSSAPRNSHMTLPAGDNSEGGVPPAPVSMASLNAPLAKRDARTPVAGASLNAPVAEHDARAPVKGASPTSPEANSGSTVTSNAAAAAAAAARPLGCPSPAGVTCGTYKPSPMLPLNAMTPAALNTDIGSTQPLPRASLRGPQEMCSSAAPVKASGSTPLMDSKRPTVTVSGGSFEGCTEQPSSSNTLDELRFVSCSDQHSYSAAQAVTAMAEGHLQCAVTGAAFDYLLQHASLSVLETVMRNAVVFARMRPHQKGQVMDLLSSKGLHHSFQAQSRHLPVSDQAHATCRQPQILPGNAVRLARIDVDDVSTSE